MLKWLKELIKKLPGIRGLVEERNRYFSLYEEQLAHNARLSEQLTITENHRHILEKALEEQKNQCDILQRENITLSSQVMQLTDRTAQLTKENQQCVIRIDALRGETEQLSKQITLLESEKAEALRQNESLKTEAEQLQKQCRAFEENQNSYRARISELENDLAQKDAALQLYNYAKRSSELSSGDFWNDHYASGGNSGTGSYHRLADFKAEIVNRLIGEYNITTAIELGCGDGNQLSLIDYPSYTGVDVSPVIIEKNRERFSGCENKVFFCSLTEREKYINNRFELGVSMDVIFHLLEEPVFHAYMDDLFTLSTHYVVIYSSNHEEYTPWPEYRHRNFTGYVSERFPQWELVHYIPNRYPYKFGSVEDTSSADFYIYKNTLV